MYINIELMEMDTMCPVKPVHLKLIDILFEWSSSNPLGNVNCFWLIDLEIEALSLMFYTDASI